MYGMSVFSSPHLNDDAHMHIEKKCGSVEGTSKLLWRE